MRQDAEKAMLWLKGTRPAVTGGPRSPTASPHWVLVRLQGGLAGGKVTVP